MSYSGKSVSVQLEQCFHYAVAFDTLSIILSLSVHSQLFNPAESFEKKKKGGGGQKRMK